MPSDLCFSFLFFYSMREGWISLSLSVSLSFSLCHPAQYFTPDVISIFGDDRLGNSRVSRHAWRPVYLRNMAGKVDAPG